MTSDLPCSKFFFLEFSDPRLLPSRAENGFHYIWKKLFWHTELCHTPQLCTPKLFFSYSKSAWRLGGGVGNWRRKIKRKEIVASWTKGQVWPKGQMCSSKKYSGWDTLLYPPQSAAEGIKSVPSVRVSVSALTAEVLFVFSTQNRSIENLISYLSTA